jgi:hypothetical protein
MIGYFFIIYSLIIAFTIQTVFWLDKFSLPAPNLEISTTDLSDRNSSIFTKQFDIKIRQRAKLRFSKLGLVEVRAVEEIGQFPRIEFINLKTNRLIKAVNLGTNQPDSFKIFDFCTKELPCAAFKVVKRKGFPNPLILAVGINYGGSDEDYEGTVIGEVNGKIEELMPEQMSISNQGGISIGNLGNKRGLGAVSWVFFWGNDNGHYGRHRYKIMIYSFNKKTRHFNKTEILETKKKYGGRGEKALTEYHLSVKDIRKSFLNLNI